MSEFIFVRHCQSTMNLQPHIISGRSNHAPATELGRQLSEQLGRYLKSSNYQPDAVFSSGALRADTTAELVMIAAEITVPLRLNQGLQELSQGSFEGLERKEVYTPQRIEQYDLTSLDGKFPGGESIAEAADRMWQFTLEAHARHQTGQILVFGHGLAIRSLTGKIMGKTKSETLAIETPNLSLTKITLDSDGQATVDYIGKNVIPE